MFPNHCSPSPFDYDIHCRIQKGARSRKCWSVPFQAFMSRSSIFLMFHSMFILFICYFLLLMISPKYFFIGIFLSMWKAFRFFIITLSSGQVCGRSKLATEMMRVRLFGNSRFKSLVCTKKFSTFFFFCCVWILFLVITRAKLFARK